VQSVLQCAFAAYISHSYSANELRHVRAAAYSATAYHTSTASTLAASYSRTAALGASLIGSPFGQAPL
jgi:hypothetical protein